MTPTKPGNNRRRSPRYDFQTEGKYSVFANQALVQSGSARTLNVSAGGLLLALDRPVPASCKLVVNLQWPNVYHDAVRVRLIASGQVVRVDGTRAALRIFSHRFHIAELRSKPARTAVSRTVAALLPPRPAA